MGVRGMANTIEKAFEECAKAMFNVEVNVKKVSPSKKIKVKVNASKIDELLVEWLNALLSQSSIHRMVFSKFKIDKIESKKGKFELIGNAFGEKLDVKKHEAKEEVKGATYSQLKVEKNKKGQWIAQCIVDV